MDRLDTHAISAIINVAQDVDEDWPLYIEGLDGKVHSIVMKPGEMILYEGAKLIHGRPTKFVGNYFANMFVHFRPTTWDFQKFRESLTESPPRTLSNLFGLL